MKHLLLASAIVSLGVAACASSGGKGSKTRSPVKTGRQEPSHEHIPQKISIRAAANTGDDPNGPLMQGQDSLSGIAVDDSHIYWTNYSDGSVFSLPKGGGSPATLASEEKR